MTYVALRDFDKFKKGDLIPNEVVEDRLIRGRKIGLVDSKVEIKEDKIISEVVQEEPEVREVELQLLIEDSSDVTIQEELDVQEELEITPESEKTSKKKK